MPVYNGDDGAIVAADVSACQKYDYMDGGDPAKKVFGVQCLMLSGALFSFTAKNKADRDTFYTALRAAMRT